MPGFGDVKVFPVIPGKEEAFEALLPEMINQLHNSQGCHTVHILKRSHTYDTLKDPPRLLTKLVKSVKYYIFCEFNTLEEYDQANRNLFANFQKRFSKFLIAPPDIACGISYLGE